MTYKGAPLMSDRQDWGTPRSFMRYLDVRFDLDVCATPKTAKAKHYFTKDDDGLSQDWWGRCWMNPPFGKDLPKWIEKAIEETNEGRAMEVYVLIPARTDTKWFHELVVPNAECIRFIKGRMNFESQSSKEGANAPFPSMLVRFSQPLPFKDGMPPLFGTIEPTKEDRGFGGLQKGGQTGVFDFETC